MLELAQFLTSLAGIGIPLGVLLLMSGRVKLKNELDTIVRIVSAFCIAIACYWLAGYSLSSTPSYYGLFGHGPWLFGRDDLMLDNASDLRTLFLYSIPPILVAAALAERGSMLSTNLLVAAVALVGVPLTIHWAWAGQDGADAGQGWLAARGFQDAGGAVVIFACAGFSGLAASLMAGPRKGRFPLLVNRPGGHSPTFHYLGAICIIFGLAMESAGQASHVSRMDEVVFNVVFGAVFAAVACLVVISLWRQKGLATDLINACLAGAIALTAFATETAPANAALAGLFAGTFAIALRRFLATMEIDDPGDLITVSIAGGITGGLVAPFMLARYGDNLLNDMVMQLAGMVAIGVWSFGLVWLASFLMGQWIDLRVSEADEVRGLSRSHLAFESEPDYLITRMFRNPTFSALRSSDKPEELERLTAGLSDRIVKFRNESHRAIDRVQSSLQEAKAGSAMAARMRLADDTLRVKTEDVLLLIEHALSDSFNTGDENQVHGWIVEALDLLMAPCLRDLDQFCRHLPLQVELEELENLVVAASESVSRCAHQVELVRDFGVAQSQSFFARDHRCDLASLFQDQKGRLQVLAEMRNSPIQIDCPLEEGLLVAGDMQAFSRIFTLTAEASFNRLIRKQDHPVRLELREQVSRQTAILECLDTGTSLSSRQIRAITQPLSEDIRLGDIGLSQIMPLILAVRLTEAMGGECFLSSEHGVGTLFKCQFRTLGNQRTQTGKKLHELASDHAA